MIRKDFALIHKDDKFARLWFLAYDGKLTSDYIDSITDESFMKLFGI